MRDKFFRYFIGIGVAVFMLTGMGWAIPPRPILPPPPSAQVDINGVIKQLRTQLSELRHISTNHESEIRTLDGKLRSQEQMFDDFREDLPKEIEGQLGAFRKITTDTTSKIEGIYQSISLLEGNVKGVMNDIRQMKTQANQLVTSLEKMQERIGQLEKIIDAQNLHMQKLEGAMQSIVDVLAIPSSGSPSGKTYKVQPGDSLGKIAIDNKVSLKALREANNLKNDKIFSGQLLKIPRDD